MARSCSPLKDLVIPNGTAVSNILLAKEQYADADAVGIMTPATIDAVAFTVEVSNDPAATAASTWFTLQIGSDTLADSSVATASKARVFYEIPVFAAFRIKAASNVAADRTFKANKTYLLT